jgi:hypothetical protein
MVKCGVPFEVRTKSLTIPPNIFIPILPLSEGRAGIAWIPSNKMLFFPLRYKAPF